RYVYSVGMAKQFLKESRKHSDYFLRVAAAAEVASDLAGEDPTVSAEWERVLQADIVFLLLVGREPSNEQLRTARRHVASRLRKTLTLGSASSDGAFSRYWSALRYLILAGPQFPEADPQEQDLTLDGLAALRLGRLQIACKGTHQ